MARALDHLEDAEAALLTYLRGVGAISEEVADEDLPDPIAMATAVLRLVSRAAGQLEAAGEEVPVTLWTDDPPRAHEFEGR